MIGRLNLAELRPEQKASLIYTQAQADLSSRLWRAALGGAGAGEGQGEMAVPGRSESPLESLIALFSGDTSTRAAAQVPLSASATPASLPVQRAETAALSEASTPPTSIRTAGLGKNQQHQEALQGAARRTGLPVSAIAAIVDAEAAKAPDGSWKLFSRNPRSSAAGLGQFLSGTWVGEAERPGTWLNETARARGWLTDAGKVSRTSQSELLALRYDAEASINATADYARANLDRMRHAGISVGTDAEDTARAAYLGHHLGLGDAVKFLKGGLASNRARTLLSAQVGSASAERRIAEAGCAATAHRTWLLSFVAKRVAPQRFEASA